MTAKQKQEHAVRLRLESYTWTQIAAAVGYNNPANACRAVMQYFKNNPAPDAEELRAQENEKLDQLEGDMLAILGRTHVAKGQNGIIHRPKKPLELLRIDGEVVYKQDGTPMFVMEEVEDDDPSIRVAATILRIHERRAKLNGLDKPIKIEIEDSSVDQEIIDLVNAITSQGPVQVPEGHAG